MERVEDRLKLTLLPIFAFCLILLPSLEATTDEPQYFYRGDDREYTIEVQSVDFSPNPVPQGQTATVFISASTNQTFNGGSVRITLEAGYCWDSTYNLCDKISCPVGGNSVLSHNGWYSLDVEFDDEGNKELTCISFQFQIVSRNSTSVAAI